jgi:hypothetical protein
MRPIAHRTLQEAVSLRWLAGLAALVLIAAGLVSCGGSNSVSLVSGNGTGTVHVSLTDPPSCAPPNGPYEHVWVTIRSVQANMSTNAGDNDPTWQELAPQLNTQPKQIDLFSLGGNGCLLATLGSNNALPAGTYQQIRLLLVPNDGGNGPLPLINECAGHGYNCVVSSTDGPHELLLSSQANTGLKIPPGQIVGGPITVAAGQSIDLNIDFNACSSIVKQGNDQYRLKPALTAGQVGTTNSISGQVVDSVTNLPLASGSTVLVALEQLNGSGTDVILEQTAADPTGHFNFCPLPQGTVFDIVAVGIDGNGDAYNATLVAGVPAGTNLESPIPLDKETSSPAGPTTFQGFVTATTGSGAATIDASVSALQTVTVNSAMRDVTIPAENIPNETASIQNISVESDTDCPANPPANANCAQYTLVEPASNPRVGSFSAGTINYDVPAPGNVLYSIRALASSGDIPACSPSTQTTNLDSSATQLKAVAGSTVPVARIDFSGC